MVFGRTKAFMKKCRRVWYVLRKPTKKEFSMIAKVSAIGIVILGLVGFIISVVMKITGI